ncbi:UNKNOWN [Stylonychia lemnae]|uniref:Uncharacterized protein n=1 Tax=Stylonychia lemnae TaxID=5949 RepID=A0A078B6Z5_STYLE|nr:UNKNOWN [Stylonychia lemnae]|eukprot:CDW89333.1 UNKNOWN [Stylonychia lemnae]
MEQQQHQKNLSEGEVKIIETPNDYQSEENKVNKSPISDQKAGSNQKSQMSSEKQDQVATTPGGGDIDNIQSLDQARKIKGQVEKDVLLLRNRVRMLQMEHEKAQKKIMETQKKAKQLEDLKAKNNEKFLQQLKYEQEHKGSLKGAQSGNFEIQKAQREQIQNAKFSMYQQKAEAVSGLKQKLNEDQKRKQELQMQQQLEQQEKKNQIRAQKEKGKVKIEKYKQKKAKEIMKEGKQKTEQEKQLIYALEGEARQLELMEEQLIRRLQTTQQMEKDAFKELEEAMITASMPKKERLKIMSEMQSNLGSENNPSKDQDI